MKGFLLFLLLFSQDLPTPIQKQIQKIYQKLQLSPAQRKQANKALQKWKPILKKLYQQLKEQKISKKEFQKQCQKTLRPFLRLLRKMQKEKQKKFSQEALLQRLSFSSPREREILMPKIQRLVIQHYINRRTLFEFQKILRREIQQKAPWEKVLAILREYERFQNEAEEKEQKLLKEILPRLNDKNRAILAALGVL